MSTETVRGVEIADETDGDFRLLDDRYWLVKLHGEWYWLDLRVARGRLLEAKPTDTDTDVVTMTDGEPVI